MNFEDVHQQLLNVYKRSTARFFCWSKRHQCSVLLLARQTTRENVVVRFHLSSMEGARRTDSLLDYVNKQSFLGSSVVLHLCDHQSEPSSKPRSSSTYWRCDSFDREKTETRELSDTVDAPIEWKSRLTLRVAIAPWLTQTPVGLPVEPGLECQTRYKLSLMKKPLNAKSEVHCSRADLGVRFTCSLNSWQRFRSFVSRLSTSNAHN